MTLKLDMMQTTALAVVIYYFGSWIKSKITILEKFCIPSPVVGGLIFAILHTILKVNGIIQFDLDTTLQKPFMMVFFTSIGMGASIDLIKKGGLQVVLFWLLASTLCLLQDGVGVLVAKLMGQNPFLGLICGSVTMTGGHGTGAAFGELFQKSYGLNGALETAMAAATFGLVTGSLIGGPIGKRLVEGKNLKPSTSAVNNQAAATTATEEKANYDEIFRTLALILISIGLGAILEKFFKNLGLTLPSYVNSMIIAAIILNVGESTGKWHVNQKCTDILGNIGLNTFLSMALVGLKLWELAAVAGPMLIILVAQATLMAVFAYFITFNVMGRDFDAAVLSAGHCGFGMGATPNGIANMDAVKEKYGPAPRAYFVLPIVGAFLIDFTNAMIITLFVNFMK
ncbi:ESS family glutamate:Na+ symporter [Clostridium tetanomorphum]|uniref:Sodium/glutamate symporter n=1 Tax=Clostridium tetanomorphum TaxID=1553 RepID=A0A923ECY5_CLOTT|nr:sodium/glutamate symporter [Clostridium tetanomorphum]KAJ50479.1 sodium/glutamate symporter [Clostridium tetanomorphum DSM 665]MBC2398270.1 sodium/glutamate symporter [Clostridium tetanomorphum]MBP1865613.1 ESS family glutamate:Na+ symporter [Clostridium tetanomorphum]NRS85881.1 ESS family glutamate:Na+ symporter [Clostridium tetanomorphum]NRZ96109.1 ESS family glutamate:Na+ symporter [Clostridium tetanomorphum]